VSNDIVGYLIGIGGATIKRVENESKARIGRSAHTRDPNRTTFTITGTSAAVRAQFPALSSARCAFADSSGVFSAQRARDLSAQQASACSKICVSDHAG